MTPIGTLIQKIQCQSMPCVTAPPTIGPNRDCETGEPAVDPDDHPAPLSRESGRQDGQTERQDDRAAEPLHRPGDDQVGRVRRQGAGDGSDGEQGEPAGEDLPPSEPVAERGGGDDASGEGDAVSVQRPLQGSKTDVQVALHARQRRDHDDRRRTGRFDAAPLSSRTRRPPRGGSGLHRLRSMQARRSRGTC